MAANFAKNLKLPRFPVGGQFRQAAGAGASVVEGPRADSGVAAGAFCGYHRWRGPLVRSVAIIDPCPRRAASHRPFEARIGALHGVGCNLVC